MTGGIVSSRWACGARRRPCITGATLAAQTDDVSLRKFQCALLWVTGETEKCRRLAKDFRESLAATSDHRLADEVAMTCNFAPGDPAGFAQLTEIHEPFAGEKHDQNGSSWQSLSAALTHLRAGHWERALDLVQKSPQESRWRPSLLALAYHGLKRDEEARRALTEADRAWLALTEFLSPFEESAAPIGPGPGWFEFIVADMLRREAGTLIEGKDPGEDPRFPVYQDHLRDRLKHLDKATADYDFAVMIDPDQPRLRLARGRRLGELGRWKEAEADLDKGVQLGREDPQIWAERGRILADWGQPDRAAADFVRALDRAATARTAPGGDYRRGGLTGCDL